MLPILSSARSSHVWQGGAGQPAPFNLMVTLWPSFTHFRRFANDPRLSGIRLNSAMIGSHQLVDELKLLHEIPTTVPLYFDVKGRQLRVVEVHENPMSLEITLNHPITLADPSTTEIPVIFKAGADVALLKAVLDDGRRLLFEPAELYGPKYRVRPGESLCIRHPSLSVEGPIFTEEELAKIELVKEAGFTRYFLSYVESEKDVTQFQELVGQDATIMLKIESPKGLEYVANEYVYRPNIRLVVARGDLYVELPKPHQILAAEKLIVEKDPEAVVGSRLMLSVIKQEYYIENGTLRFQMVLHPVPNSADFHELAWLYEIGYRTVMLCDELCLREDLLATAVNAVDSFRQTYA